MMGILIRRNVKMFFREKGMFFTSLITPGILLVLYVSFLGNVYRDSFESAFAPYGGLEDALLSGCVGAQLMSSLLAVCCVTVSFCSNFLMVQDKANGTRRDFSVTPVKGSVLAFSYFAASYLASLLICLTALGLCLGYVAMVGWYLSVCDLLLLLLDVVLLVLFGTALSGVISCKLSSQGHISAVGSIVSSTYGFFCGAYMPISQFAPILQKVLSFFPGTYATSLMRNHSMEGVFREMEAKHIPAPAIEEMKKAMDCRIDFLGTDVPRWAMYGILCATIAVLIALYVWMNRKKEVEG